MHGIFVWLYGPEHTLVTFQLQKFWGRKKSDFFYRRGSMSIFHYHERGDAFLRDKNILIKEALFIERQILLEFGQKNRIHVILGRISVFQGHGAWVLKVICFPISHLEARLCKPQNRKLGGEWQPLCTVGNLVSRRNPVRFLMWMPHGAKRKTKKSEVDGKLSMYTDQLA